MRRTLEEQAAYEARDIKPAEMSDRLYRLITRRSILPRPKSKGMLNAIETRAKYPVNYTAAIPADLMEQLNDFCRKTAVRKYELLIAAIYQYLVPKGLLHDDDASLLLYVNYVEKLITHAQLSRKFPIGDSE